MSKPLPPEAEHRQDVDRAFLKAARTGNQDVFGSLFELYRRELLAHCYRMVGSLLDAEDLVQDTYLRAWRGRHTYAGRGSLRAWLYKIATNACLDFLAQRKRRSLPQFLRQAATLEEAGQPAVSDPVWLEPYPDELLAPTASLPEARYEARESITLAFLAATQTLHPRQRCALILCDVLDWSVKEISELLETSASSVNSLLYRARSKMGTIYLHDDYLRQRAAESDPRTERLLDRYLRAWENANHAELVSLLTEDITFPMPPLPQWYRGRASVGAFIAAAIMDRDRPDRWRILPTQANGQHAFAWYQKEPGAGLYQAFAIQVMTIRDGLFSDITTFGFPHLFSRFGLPLELS